jgi:adenylosuccinate synthase
MDGVDDSLEYLKTLRRQTDTSADHNTVIVSESQVTLHRLPSGFIRSDVAHITLPASVCHLLERKSDAALIFSAFIPGG